MLCFFLRREPRAQTWSGRRRPNKAGAIDDRAYGMGGSLKQSRGRMRGRGIATAQTPVQAAAERRQRILDPALKQS